MPFKLNNQNWRWLIPLLLLIMAMALPRLDQDGLWYDEIWSLRNAGGAQYGALSPAGIWEQVAFNDPHQAFGYPYLLAIWGGIAGWSEYAGRLLSLFAALLTIAVTYRLGREINRAGDQIAFFTTLILSTSAFFLYYTHELRAFTLVALAAAILLLAYNRLLRTPSLRRIDAALFVIGGVGLLYTHYFAAATLLGALGIYHLLLAPKNRRWVQIVGSALVIGLLFLPEVPAFLRGFSRFSPEDVNKIPLTAGEALWSFAHYLGNGAVLLVALLLILGMIQAWRQKGGLRVIVGISFFAVLLTLLANAFLGILEPQRLRYTIVLWPGLAVWAGAGFSLLVEWLRKSTRPDWLMRALLVILPGLWVVNALLVYADADFTLPLHGDRVVRWRTMTNVMQAEGGAADLFAFYAGTATEAYPITSSFTHSTEALTFPALITSTATDPVSAENRAWAAERIASAQRLWVGVDQALPLTEDFLAFRDGLAEQFVHCATYVEQADLMLDLYARSATFCPAEESAITYSNDLALLQYDVQQTDNALTIEMLWEIPASIPPGTFNLALHLTPQGSDSPVAQADHPLPAGNITPLLVALDLSELEPGSYSLYAIVYDWQSGLRLSGSAEQEILERFPLGNISLP